MSGSHHSTWLQLLSHPMDPATFAPFHLESSVHFQKELARLKVAFRVTGPINEILWPKESPTHTLERGQKLWEHTCFELFISSPQNPNYFEWNLSSNQQWDHFHFQSYRQSSAETQNTGAILKIDFKKTANSALLDSEIDLKQLPNLEKILERGEAISLSTTVVLENKKFEKSYWALSHQDAKPDFHNRNSFISKIL